MSFIRRLAAAILPFAKEYEDFHLKEITEEVSQATAITMAETQPMDSSIILGPRFPSRKANRQIIELAIGLKRGIVLGRRGALTFHFGDGSHIEIIVSKPFVMRKYKGGCIVKVDAPFERNESDK